MKEKTKQKNDEEENMRFYFLNILFFCTLNLYIEYMKVSIHIQFILQAHSFI